MRRGPRWGASSARGWNRGGMRWFPTYPPHQRNFTPSQPKLSLSHPCPSEYGSMFAATLQLPFLRLCLRRGVEGGLHSIRYGIIDFLQIFFVTFCHFFLNQFCLLGNFFPFLFTLGFQMCAAFFEIFFKALERFGQFGINFCQPIFQEHLRGANV